LRKALDEYVKAAGKDVLFDVPLLFEAGWESHFDAVLAVWAEPEVRWKRLTERGMSDEDVRRRDDAQMPSAVKLERADFALINNGTLDDLRLQCEIVSDTIRKRFSNGLEKVSRPRRV
jgi:dephospho-CoA kinase